MRHNQPRPSRWAGVQRGLLVLAGLWLAGGPGGAQSVGDARALLRDGNGAAAQQMLQAIVDATPNNLDAQLWLGRAALETGDYVVAERALRAALAGKADWPDAEAALGLTFERSGRTAEARETYRAVLKQFPDQEMAAEGLARLEALGAQATEPGRTASRRVGLTATGDLVVDREQIRVESPDTYDYTFADAPCDWVAESGDWRVRSRWSCTPDWNWMGGEGPQAAALWNKREFVGDLTVEMFASFKMNVMGEGGYRNGTDLNITLCGDGRNLASGYSFVIGGWANTASAIMKGNQVLARTTLPQDKPVTLLDGGYGTWYWHRRWWEIRARKQGNQLALYFDNRLILQATDPDPLPGGRVGVWTFDNGLMVPRVKIHYETERNGAERTEPQYLTPPADLLGGAQEPRIRVTSTTHPSLMDDFEGDLGEFAPRGTDPGAMVWIVEGGPGGLAGNGHGERSSGTPTATGGHCLRIVNRNSGGPFGVTARSTEFSAVAYPRLAFDYRVPPELKVNLQLTAGGQPWEIAFTAPEYPAETCPVLAALPDVQADNRWHHVDLDLLGLLRQKLPSVAEPTVSDVHFSVESYRDYILAGFGGNPALCEWELDNFGFYRPGPATAQFAVSPLDSQSASPGYEFVVDERPDTIPGEDATQSASGELMVTAPQPGEHYLHVRGRSAQQAGTTRHVRFVVDEAGPALAATTPADASRASGATIAAQLSDQTGIDPQSIRLRVKDSELPLGAALHYDPVAGTLELDPTAAGLTLNPGETVPVAITAATDWLGHPLAQPLGWSFVVDRAEDHQPPPPPVIAGPAALLCDDTFEDAATMGQWQRVASAAAAWLTLDPTTAASGHSSLRLYNPVSGGTFGTTIRSTPFDAAVYRLVSFDYKCPPEVRADLLLSVNGTQLAVPFMDTDTPNRLAPAPQITADNEWHHCAFDLYQMLRAWGPTQPGYVVNAMVLSAGGAGANIQHQTFHLDNFRIAPVISPVQVPQLAVAAADVSGIAGLSWVVDGDPGTNPPERVNDEALTVPTAGLAPGPAWLHVRTEDGAGNWSETTHEPLLNDATPPTCAAQEPADGAAAAPARVRLSLTDEGAAGVNPRSIRLDVGGTTYDTTNPGLVYNAADGTLTFSVEQVTPGPVVFADGQQVAARLVAASDAAGNPVAMLPAWSWTMDYKQDTVGPPLRTLASTTHASLPVAHFESGGALTAYGDPAATSITMDDTTAASGQRSAKVANVAAGGALGVYLIGAAFDTATYPILSFDYAVPAGVTADLVLAYAGETLPVQFTDNAGGYFGTVAGVQADGAWHHATVDLQAVVKARGAARGLTAATVGYVLLLHRGADQLPAGAALNLDNIGLAAAGPADAALTWSATDPTGIAGYSHILDDVPFTEAPAEGAQPETTAAAPGLAPGLHYFHVRARDGAGNWGPTSHYALLVM